MSQIFRKRTNLLAKISIVLGGATAAGILVLGSVLDQSPYYTRVGVPREQPIPFSHKHHVGGLGIDCRFCHTSVEDSSFAGIPPTATCMKCHSEVWKDAPMLEPVRESMRSGKPIEWTRVHDVPDFVYFDHSIHIAKGVSCQTCHGRVDEMPLMKKENTLFMGWCIECHRNPEKFVGPKEHVFEMGWKADEDQLTMGNKLVKDYNIKTSINCSTCHR
ncbi:MAG: hypothetical protein ACI9CF_000750 [Candidatus Omnitrophota bacterium]|jgi:hypothetical protein